MFGAPYFSLCFSINSHRNMIITCFNLTLKKIKWRLDHPLANTLARLITRNNSIDRSIKQEKPFENLLPDPLKVCVSLPTAPSPPPRLSLSIRTCVRACTKFRIAQCAAERTRIRPDRCTPHLL